MPARKPYSIAAVTVTFNGARVVRHHLQSLKRQTRPMDEIVVVDNASSDDTHHLLATEFPEITVLRMTRNIGVGGGFAAGLSYAALEKKYDWVWLFDQDSQPADDALERLLSGLEFLPGDAQNTAILAPVCVHPKTDVICTALSWRGSRLVATPANADQPITLVDSVISSGTLIRREAVEFFMDFVDHDYCLRLRRRGYKIAVVRESLLRHTLGDPARFTILGRTKFWTDHAPWREYYMIRNEVHAIWRDYPRWSVRAFTFYRLFWHIVDILLFGKQKLACLVMIYRGILDGLAGRLGIRFLPADAEQHSTGVRNIEKFAQRTT